jgi:inorganic pyrophosphatase
MKNMRRIACYTFANARARPRKQRGHCAEAAMPIDRFWTHLDELIAAARLVIDRPRHSRHPRYPELIYPYDYGYLEGTTAADGGGIDVWLGSLPERRLGAVICTVDLVKRDTELKLLLGCTPREAQEILRFCNDAGLAGLLVER